MHDLTPEIIEYYPTCDYCGASIIEDIVAAKNLRMNIPLRKMELQADGTWMCEKCEPEILEIANTE